MKKAERERYSAIVEIGCIICRRPAEVHHLTGAGMGRKAPYQKTIPLCPDHHRNGGPKIAIHSGVKTWEAIFGTQEKLLERVNEEIGAT